MALAAQLSYISSTFIIITFITHVLESPRNGKQGPSGTQNSHDFNRELFQYTRIQVPDLEIEIVGDRKNCFCHFIKVHF